MPLGSVSNGDDTLTVDGGIDIKSLEAVEELPLASQTQQATVVPPADVADVEQVTEEQTSITRMNRAEALSISITAVQDADVVSVSHELNDAMEELTQEVSGLDLSVVFDQAPFSEESIQDLAIEGRSACSSRWQ